MNGTDLGWDITDLEEGMHGDIVDVSTMFCEFGQISEAKPLLFGPGPSPDHVEINGVGELEIWG
jgi:hypothetical protein